MVYYLNTFENFDNYKNIFIINYLNVYTSIPIPITMYSEILSLYGICHITDEHNNIQLQMKIKIYIFLFLILNIMVNLICIVTNL